MAVITKSDGLNEAMLWVKLCATEWLKIDASLFNYRFPASTTTTTTTIIIIILVLIQLSTKQL